MDECRLLFSCLINMRGEMTVNFLSLGTCFLFIVLVEHALLLTKALIKLARV